MRGDLAKARAEILAKWHEIQLYQQIQQARAANAPLWVLHDGRRTRTVTYSLRAHPQQDPEGHRRQVAHDGGFRTP